MSVNRENVTWQSPDGTWNRGFYEFWYVNEDSHDFDPEWDVMYGDDFCWVTCGLPNEEATENVWEGANPGGTMVIPYNPADAETIARLDEKAAQARAKLEPNTNYNTARRKLEPNTNYNTARGKTWGYA